MRGAAGGHEQGLGPRVGAGLQVSIRASNKGSRKVIRDGWFGLVSIDSLSCLLVMVFAPVSQFNVYHCGLKHV